MNNTEILLSNNTSNEEKYEAANNIIINYELSLNVEQIMLSHKRVYTSYITIAPGNLNIYIREYHKNNSIFVFNTLLNINKDMYTALILALCCNFDPEDLWYFIIFKNGRPYDIGLRTLLHESSIKNYYKLLDHYEFDVNIFQSISSMDKQIIQAYRVKKYSGKLVKRAIKNEK